MNTQRILLISLIVIVIVGAGIGVWYFLSQDDTATETNSGNANTTNSTATNTQASTPTVSTAPIFVYTLQPRTGSAAGGETVTVNGQNFIQGAKVFFNNREAEVTFVSDTELTVVTPQGDAGTVPVKVSNPDGLSGVLTNGFIYE